MSAARELANFLTGVSPSDLPAQAMDHAASGKSAKLAPLGTGELHRPAAIPTPQKIASLTPVGSSWRGSRCRSTPAPLEIRR